MARTILVVEDDLDTQLMMKMLLEDHGFDVATAGNGREALVEVHRVQPLVIVLDLMMPTMGGEQFRRVQMRDAAIRDIPVVVVSACHDAAEIACRVQAVACVPKPLDVARLVGIIERIASPAVAAQSSSTD